MTGISMGATLAYFLAAIDQRVSAVAHLCCYADLATLVEIGAHDLHGHYLTVPGLLAETSSGAIAGLVAPRPQLICVGSGDPLTPPLAVARAYADQRCVWVQGRLDLAGGKGRRAPRDVDDATGRARLFPAAFPRGGQLRRMIAGWHARTSFVRGSGCTQPPGRGPARSAPQMLLAVRARRSSGLSCWGESGSSNR